jgi:metal-responsive CopG/Arc/MetJ family transcriptional regulator
VERDKPVRMKLISLRLPQPLYDMLTAYSKKTGLKYSEIIRQALYEYLRAREGVVGK